MATTVETGVPTENRVRLAWRRFARAIGERMPKGLFARSLIIIITPVVILQALVAFVFMERHWQQVSARLSAAVVADIAAIIDVMQLQPAGNYEDLAKIAADRLGLTVSVLPPEPLPAPRPKPFFSQLDHQLSREIAKQIRKPFWIDTVGRSQLVEIRIQLDGKMLRVFAPRSQTYVSNSLIFITWMVGSSLVLLAIAILFLRNQIKPILMLAAAAENFGKGRAAPVLMPRGAREVRQATVAFQDMRGRIERQVEQRTAMLAGVSHDLRTVLTRFRLQLALIEEAADVEAMKADIDDMNRMLEGYLSFARGDTGEETRPTDIAAMLDQLAAEARISGDRVMIDFDGDPTVKIRPQSFKRCIGNLVKNACRHGETVQITGLHADGHLTITVDDDGPGVPVEEHEAVFKPFYRLDEARNIDNSGTGLGLSIARDIAHSHGGDITLSKSPLGGLRATVAIPA